MTPLSLEEVRLLGCLLEKETTTPEYYPMTLNALMAAANQKTNRDPVVSYDEETAREALAGLRGKGLLMEITGAGNRVPKYAHRLPETINLGRREFALLCVLMLRGPQTLGELRDRTERMYEFSDLEEVEHVLDTLAARDPDPLVMKLPRVAGTKEPRYMHLLASLTELPPEPVAHGHEPLRGDGARVDRIAQLEAELAALRGEVAQLKQQFAEFRRQFE